MAGERCAWPRGFESCPETVVAHGWLLVGGAKMSKSAANQIDPVELAGEVGLDPLRYHLLRDVTLGADGDFTYEGLIGRYNADLANNLGNLLARVTTLVTQKCDSIAPPPTAGSRLAAVASEVVAEARAAWERSAPHEALETTWRLIRESNAELETTEPWKLPPGAEVERVLGDARGAAGSRRCSAFLRSPTPRSRSGGVSTSPTRRPTRASERPSRASSPGDAARAAKR